MFWKVVTYYFASMRCFWRSNISWIIDAWIQSYREYMLSLPLISDISPPCQRLPCRGYLRYAACHHRHIPVLYQKKSLRGYADSAYSRRKTLIRLT